MNHLPQRSSLPGRHSRRRSSAKRGARSRRGAVALITALMATVFLAIVACVVDLSLLRMWRQELQFAVDAAALAGTAQLDGTADGIDRARATARLVAGQNDVAGSAVSLDANNANAASGDIVLGYWEDDIFHPYASDPSRVTTVKVASNRDDLQPVFAPVAFADDRPFARMGIAANSTVLGGGPAVEECPIPIAFPDCALEAQANVCDMKTQFGSDKNDNAGWARIGGQRPSASYISDAIHGICPEASTLDGTVTLNNGSISSAVSEMAYAVGTSTEYWDTAEWGTIPARMSCSSIAANKYGRVIVGKVPIFHDATNCTATKYTGSNLDVVGYATAVIYDVCATGASKDRKIAVRMVCSLEEDTVGGGGYYGTVVPPRRVE